MFNIILNTSPCAALVCTQKPVGIIVDTTKLRHQSDLRSDDMGSWIHKGKPVHLYELERSSSGRVYNTKRCKDNSISEVYKLTRIYYHHQGIPQFRKTIFYVHGKRITVT